MLKGESGFSILSIGLNASYQKTLSFGKFQYGQVNRADSLKITAGGKGQHVAKALSMLMKKNSASSVKIAHFLGGNTGKFIEDDLQKRGIGQILVRTQYETRTCTTLLCKESQQMTEVIEPSGEISKEELQQMEEKIKVQLPKVQAISISGTYPPGVTQDFFKIITDAKKDNNFLLLLDSYKGVNQILESKTVDILKINALEFQSLTGKSSLEEGVIECFAIYSMNSIALTDGPSIAHLFERTANGEVLHYEYSIPKLTDIINPIGAGDTCSAVFLFHLLSGTPSVQAFQKALGAASASCLASESASFELQTAEELGQRIIVTMKNMKI